MKTEKDRDYENFCYNIAFLRERVGFSKKKMAEVLGIGIKSLNMIESGSMPPRMEVNALFEVWDHFDIHPAQMLRDRLEETLEAE